MNNIMNPDSGAQRLGADLSGLAVRCICVWRGPPRLARIDPTKRPDVHTKRWEIPNSGRQLAAVSQRDPCPLRGRPAQGARVCGGRNHAPRLPGGDLLIVIY